MPHSAPFKEIEMPERIKPTGNGGTGVGGTDQLPAVDGQGNARYLSDLFTNNKAKVVKDNKVSAEGAKFLLDLTMADALPEALKTQIKGLVDNRRITFARSEATTALKEWSRGAANTGVSNVNGGSTGAVTPADGNVGATNPNNSTNSVTNILGGNVDVPTTAAKQGAGPHPVVQLLKLNADVAQFFGSPEKMLNDAVLRDVTGTQANDPFWKSQSSGETKHLIVEGGAVMKDLKAGFGISTPTPLLDAAFQAYASDPAFALKAATTLTPGQVQLADGTKGQRVCVYSPDWHEITMTVHSHGDDLVQKTMKHRAHGHTVGTPKELCGGDAFSFDSTHKGWFDPFFDEHGKPVLGRGDYPTDYGEPATGRSEYTFRTEHINRDAIGFQKALPDATWKEAVAFVRTLGALSMGKMPFSSGDLEAHERSYFINDLNNDRHTQVQPEVELLGKKLTDTVTIDGKRVTVADALKDRSKYCAEGAEDRPARLLHAFGTEGLREMKKVFDAAVTADQTQRGAAHPDNRVGWKALETAGFISNYSGLINTNMAYAPFVVPGAEYKGLAAFDPKAMIKTKGPGEGLLSQPVSIAALVEAAIGSLLPRDQMAAKMGTEPLLAAFTKADAAGKEKLLAEGRDFVNAAITGIKAKVGPLAAMVKTPPLETIHDVAKAVGLVLAGTGIQTGVLMSQEIQDKVREQARYQYMTAGVGAHAPSLDQKNGKEQFDALVNKLVGLTMMPVDARTLHGILDKEERDIRSMTFSFDYPGGNHKDTGVIVYLPPHHAVGACDGWFQRGGELNGADFYPDGFKK
jgi:hypothetical protein